MPDKVNVGRIAFRHEGEFWNAYWAPQMYSMEGAVLLATIRMNLVDGSSVMRDQFMMLAKAAFSVVVKDITNQHIVAWKDPIPAPENERPAGTPVQGEFLTSGGKGRG